MFYDRKSLLNRTPHFSSPRQQDNLSSSLLRSLPTFSRNASFSQSCSTFDSHISFLLSPSHSEYDSRQNEVRVQRATLPTRQPIANPHAHVLHRTIDNCPHHLTGKKRTIWIKKGLQAQNNHQLTSTLPRFQSPESYYDPPIHIHSHTPEFLIRGLTYKISNVRTYTIDTELDRPTRQNPHPVPALIQVQAIHREDYSTILLIEVQHLPNPSTSLFKSIQRLCRTIFSCMNKIMAWGEVRNELRPFDQFELFDISQVTNTLNLQEYFTRQWNLSHPHSSECISRHQSIMEESPPDDVLICLVNSDDLNDEYDERYPTDDFNTCLCPNEIRPYKTKNALWSLQKAIQYVFHEALDKSLTFNFWSCGLDLSLNTWTTQSQRCTRLSLTNYAIHDLLAPTRLFFHLERTQFSSASSVDTVQSNNFSPTAAFIRSSFLVITDSHGKFLPPVTTRADYILTITATPGLQWTNPNNPRLCCKSLLLSSTFSSQISVSRAILFLVGSNSVRTTGASTILAQIEEITDILRSAYPHLNDRTSISISYTFPCFKPSLQYPTCSLLLANIQAYNEGLHILSLRKEFSIIHFPITSEHLSLEGLHIQMDYLYILYNNILEYFTHLPNSATVPSHSKRRSRAAIQRRNKRRHTKLLTKQSIYTLVRTIARVWHLHDLKQYLQHKNIHYARLPEIYHHQLRIQFNSLHHLQYAERTLLSTDFDENNYYKWISPKLT